MSLFFFRALNLLKKSVKARTNIAIAVNQSRDLAPLEKRHKIEKELFNQADAMVSQIFGQRALDNTKRSNIVIEVIDEQSPILNKKKVLEKAKRCGVERRAAIKIQCLFRYV